MDLYFDAIDCDGRCNEMFIRISFQTRERELKPGGKEIAVTDENKKEYME